MGGDSLGSIVSAGPTEYVPKPGMMRVCRKCGKNKLASTNPGPCHRCKNRYGRKIDKTKDWCIEVPTGTKLPVSI